MAPSPPPRLLLSALACVAAAVLPAPARADALTGRLLVTLRHDGRVHAAAERLDTATGARRSGHTVPALGVVTVRPRRRGASLHRLAARLRAQPGVAHVELEHRFALRTAPDDPALTTQEPAAGTPPGTPVEWWAQREGLLQAWDITHGTGATVAVIDTGVDATHPELASKIDATEDLDDDQGTGPATVDESGHGTHVASLACARPDNGIGLVGAGYDCHLLVYKSDLTESSVAQAIMDATARGADAINMSFGTDGSSPVAQAVEEAIHYAYDHGVVLVAAAADDRPTTEQGDPANALQPTGTGPDIGQGLGLSVTAANFADQRATFAGYGTQISLAAYGAYNVGSGGPPGLLGAFPAATTSLERGSLVFGEAPCDCRTTFDGDRRYAYLQGTSMAAPMVAGAAALVKHLNPDLTAADVIRVLKQTARRPAGTGWTPDLGWGILDAGAAVAAARSIDLRPPATRVTVATSERSTRLTLRVRGGDVAPPGCVASGLDHIDLYRTIDGRRPKRIARGTARVVHLTVRRGPKYTFYAVGVDRAGNREAVPVRPDVRVRLAR